MVVSTLNILSGIVVKWKSNASNLLTQITVLGVSESQGKQMMKVHPPRKFLTDSPFPLGKKIRRCMSVFSLLQVSVLVAQSCLTLCNPMVCSPPGSSVHGILQATTLENVFAMVPCPSPGDLPDPGIKPRSPALQADLFLSPVNKGAFAF